MSLMIHVSRHLHYLFMAIFINISTYQFLSSVSVLFANLILLFTFYLLRLCLHFIFNFFVFLFLIISSLLFLLMWFILLSAPHRSVLPAVLPAHHPPGHHLGPARGGWIMNSLPQQYQPPPGSLLAPSRYTKGRAGVSDAGNYISVWPRHPLGVVVVHVTPQEVWYCEPSLYSSELKWDILSRHDTCLSKPSVR